MAKPNLYAAHTVRAYLLGAGVEVSGGVKLSPSHRPEEGPRQALPGGGRSEAEPGTAHATTLGTHGSVPLRELAALINKPSNNFLADRLALTVGQQAFGGEYAMDKGVRVMGRWLDKIGVPEGTYRLENGSGLSHTIHISPKQIVGVLMAASQDERYGKDWVSSLSIGGLDGTLRGRFAGRPSFGLVRGKTGSLDGVAALSGFVTAGGDDEICFAILTAGFRDRRKPEVRAAQADIVDAMHHYLAARAEASGKVLAPPPVAQPAPAGLVPARTAKISPPRTTSSREPGLSSRFPVQPRRHSPTTASTPSRSNP